MVPWSGTYRLSGVLAGLLAAWCHLGALSAAVSFFGSVPDALFQVAPLSCPCVAVSDLLIAESDSGLAESA